VLDERDVVSGRERTNTEREMQERVYGITTSGCDQENSMAGEK